MESNSQNENLPAESARQIRPLYWVLMGAMGFLYYWALKAVPSLSDPTHFVTFTTLMLIHALLHLAGANIASRRQWLIPYFVAQGALIFSIVYMAPGGGFIYGLYWAMAGEAASSGRAPSKTSRYITESAAATERSARLIRSA